MAITKRGFMKSLEAVLASLMILAFVAFVIPTNANNTTSDYVGVLNKLQHDNSFRACVTVENQTCVENKIQLFLPKPYDTNFLVIITQDKNELPPKIDAKEIITENIFISTDDTTIKNTIVRLYYWN